jgi:Ni/Fe-hydrogenase subunit HybB-like protein
VFQITNTYTLNLACPVDSWAYYYFSILLINDTAANFSFGILSNGINNSTTNFINLASLSAPIPNYVSTFGEYSQAIISNTRYYSQYMTPTEINAEIVKGATINRM